MGTLRNRYSPPSPVVVVSAASVWVLTSLTCAPGTADPDGSVTVPSTVASNWANAADTDSTRNRTIARIFMAWAPSTWLRDGVVGSRSVSAEPEDKLKKLRCYRKDRLRSRLVIKFLSAVDATATLAGSFAFVV